MFPFDKEKDAEKLSKAKEGKGLCPRPFPAGASHPGTQGGHWETRSSRGRRQAGLT